MHYHDDGQYQTDIQAVTHHAQHYLLTRITQNQLLPHPKPLAVVFDIDETTLSNYQSMHRLNFGGTLSAIRHAEMAGDDTTIVPSLQLYNFAKHHRVKVFFITGRHKNERQITARNLNSAGYHHWDGLFFKPNSYHYASAIPFKSSRRQHLEQQGYDIALSIGDQWSDLNGGYADKIFKLPNPFYHVP